MPIRFPSSSFFESSGQASQEFIEGLRDGIAQHACNIWSAFPGFITNDRNAVSSFARGYMNSVCSGRITTPPYTPREFDGGQCCDKEYLVNVFYTLRRCDGDIIIAESQGVEVSITGAIIGIFLDRIPTNPAFTGVYLQAEECDGTINTTIVISSTRGISTDGCQTSDSGNVADAINVDNSQFGVLSVRTADGSPDDCGNPPGGYPDIQPNPGDLDIIIFIPNPDGTDNRVDITWNQSVNNYNFPMFFKVNGGNVIFDGFGITFSGDINITGTGDNGDVPPPGSDGGRDSDLVPYVVPFPDSGIVTVPDLTVPETIQDVIEYIICTDGVLETITETIKRIPSLTPVLSIIVDVLGNLVQEICELETGGDLAFPETYPVLPGTRRPAIVYIYKEVINGERQRSTFSSTVSNPSSSAIAAIQSVVVPDKDVGHIAKSLLLTDGSRISATGNTDPNALANFNFLLGQVDTTLVPADVSTKIVTTIRQGVVIRTLQCSQIEYYPDGKASGVTPAIKRFIPPPMS